MINIKPKSDQLVLSWLGQHMKEVWDITMYCGESGQTAERESRLVSSGEGPGGAGLSSSPVRQQCSLCQLASYLPSR